MKRMDRRTSMLVASVGTTGLVLTACGNDPDDVDLNPTMIPTLARRRHWRRWRRRAAVRPPKMGPPRPGGRRRRIELEAQDPYNRSTNELEAAPGQVIRVTNTGLAEHDFTIDELSIAEQLPNGEPVDITLPDDLTVGDTYTYYCAVPGHRENGMEGTLTIVEASAAPAEEEAASPEEGAKALEGCSAAQ